MKKNLLVFALLAMFAAVFNGCINQDPSVGDCSGDGSCNVYPPTPPIPNCALGETLTTIWVDNDDDDLAEQLNGNGMAMDVCIGNSVEIPNGWTDHDPCDANGQNCNWDPCPNDPLNQCGTNNPACSLTAVASGHTVNLNATSTYDGATVTSVDFRSGSITLITDTVSPWHYDWPNVPNGIYTLSALCSASDGHTAHSNNVTVTINDTGNTCLPQIRCTYNITEGTRFHGITTGFLTSINGQDPSWQWMPFQACGGPSNTCTISGNLWPNALNAGFAQFNGAGPSGLNGNPVPSFTTFAGDPTDWLLTRYQNGNTVQYNDETNNLHCEINPQCEGWVDVEVGYINHPWGANYLLDFSEVTDPGTGNILNVHIIMPIDSDGDGFQDYCPAGSVGCVPDNCIRFSNPTQADTDGNGVGDACVNHPNPSENDTDNDWYLDGPNVTPAELDHYPLDRTRF